MLQGLDEQATRAYFDADVRKAFMPFAGSNAIIEMHSDTLMMHRGRRLKPDQIEQLLVDARGLHEQLSSPSDPLLNW